jgi:hypothetical protein
VRSTHWSWIVLVIGFGGLGLLAWPFADALKAKSANQVPRASVLTLIALVLLLDPLGLARFAVLYGSLRANIQAAARIRALPEGTQVPLLTHLNTSWRNEAMRHWYGSMEPGSGKGVRRTHLKMNDEWRKTEEVKSRAELLKVEHAIASFVASYMLLPHFALTTFVLVLARMWEV